MSRLPRKHMGVSTKLDAALHRLGLFGLEIEWNHSPPLGMRDQIRDEDGNFIRYEPDENDPRYIVPMIKDEHRAATYGKRHDVSNGDTHKIWKARRLSKAEAEFRQRLLSKGEEQVQEKPKRKIPSRKFRQQRRVTQ